MDKQAAAEFGVRPNRLALALVVTAACCIGLLPYLRFLGRLDALAAVFVALAAASAFASIRPFPTEATERPSLGEWLLGVWSAVAMPAVASLLKVYKSLASLLEKT